jgi:hypothetical protein
MEPEGSLPCPQEPSIDPYLEPDESSSYHLMYLYTIYYIPVTVAARFKAWSAFPRSGAGIGSNPIHGMDVWCVYAFILFVLSCV